jgi:hypothetical protein
MGRTDWQRFRVSKAAVFQMPLTHGTKLSLPAVALACLPHFGRISPAK